MSHPRCVSITGVIVVPARVFGCKRMPFAPECSCDARRCDLGLSLSVLPDSFPGASGTLRSLDIALDLERPIPWLT